MRLPVRFARGSCADDSSVGTWFEATIKCITPTKNLGRNSLQHVRSLASGIFTRAVNLGLIDVNPWSAVRLQESRAPEPTVAYTLKETLAIQKALSGRVDAALVFSLAAFLGLRPSEIAGLRWEDVTGEEIYIRQAVVRGVAGDTKDATVTADIAFD